MTYLNCINKQDTIKTDGISTKYEEILVNKPVPWYGHTLTNSSDEPIVFPAQQTYMSISIIPRNVLLEIWVDGKNLFNISLNISSFKEEKEEDDDTKDEGYLLLCKDKGELHTVEGEDYIDTLIEHLETLASKLIQNEDTKDIYSIALVHEEGVKVDFVLKGKNILLQMLYNGKETIIEEFDTYEKVIAYTYLLNSAKEKAK